MPQTLGTLAVAAARISQAWRKGHRIVPIIGAGLSADAGVPPLAGIQRYLASLAYFIRGSHLSSTFKYASLQDFKLDNCLLNLTIPGLVKAVGWPDRYILNGELKACVATTHDQDGLDCQIYRTLDKIANLINPTGIDTLDSFAAAVAEKAWHYLKKDLKQHKPLPPDDKDSLAKITRPPSTVASESFRLLANWKQLIRWATDHDATLADSLFMSIYAHRRPSSAHVYLTHLIHVLGVRTVLTFNFDDFLESSLTAEGINVKVFEMERGKTLPPRILLGNDLALIKMHGGKLNLLLDERLDYPLSDEYKTGYAAIVGTEPLLFVAGCSADDHRLRDLVEYTVKTLRGSVVWMMYGIESPDGSHLQTWLSDLISPSKDKHPVSLVPFRDTAQTMAGIYSGVTGRFPASRASYINHILCPLLRDVPKAVDAEIMPIKLHTRCWEHAFTLVTCFANDNTLPGATPICSASMAMTSLLRVNNKTHKTIWIDLEAHFSLGEVVSAIIEQCRKGDTQLSPTHFPVLVADSRRSTLSVGINPKRAAEVVFEAVSREQYVLAFDGVEALPWNPLSHHGITWRDDSAELHARQVDDFFTFLRELIARMLVYWKPGDTVVWLAVDEPRPRHDDKHQKQVMNQVKIKEKLNKAFLHLSPSGVVHGITFRPHLPSVLPFDLPHEEWPLAALSAGRPLTLSPSGSELILMLLCSIRRTRPSILLMHLFDIVLENDERKEALGTTTSNPVITDSLPFGAEQAILASLADPKTNYDVPLLHVVEGAGFTMDRPLRDFLYSQNTKHTSKHVLGEFGNTPYEQNKKQAESQDSAAIRQLLIAALCHHLIARTYYVTLFLTSNDYFQFVEYVYHRLSSCRYLLLVERYLWQRWALTPHPHGAAHLTSTIASVYKRYKAQSQVCDPLYGGWSESADNALYDFILRCQRLRIIGLQGLRQSWIRDEVGIRTKMPAEQAILLCSRLSSEVLRAAVYIKDADARMPFRDDMPEALKTRYETWRNTEMEREKDTQSAVRLLADSINDTLAKCHYERGDYFAFVLLRLKSLQTHLNLNSISATDVANVIQKFDEAASLATLVSVEETDSDIVGVLNQVLLAMSVNSAPLERLVPIYQYILDIGLGLHWLLFSRDSESHTKCIGRVVTLVETHFLGVNEDRLKTRDCEIVARAWYIKLEMLYSGEWNNSEAASKKTGAEKENMASELHARVDGRLRDIARAIDIVREESPRTGSVFSPMLNTTADPSLYVPYRSLFHILQGRFRLLIAMQSPSSKQWPHVYRDFEVARVRVDDSNPILFVMADLLSAKACLEHASVGREEMLRGASEWDAGLAKLRSARGYLQRCENFLTTCPRYIIVWREFYIQAVRYQYERLAVLYIRLHKQLHGLNQSGENAVGMSVFNASHKRLSPEGEPRVIELNSAFAELVVRARRGTTALRHLLDYSSPNAGAQRLEWCRLWLKMTHASLNVGAVLGAWAGHGQGPTFSVSKVEFIDDLLSCWLHHNATKGLTLSGTGAALLRGKTPEMVYRRPRERLGYLNYDSISEWFADKTCTEQWSIRLQCTEEPGFIEQLIKEMFAEGE